MPDRSITIAHDVVRQIVPETCDTTHDRELLRTCMGISRSFWQVSRETLFSKVTISNARAQGLNNLLKILRSNPGIESCGIAPFVKSLSVETAAGGRNAVDIMDHHGDTLADILNALHGPDFGITSLALVSPAFKPISTNWVNLSTYLQHALRDVLRSPRLKYAHLSQLHNVPNTFLRGTHLEELELTTVAFRKEPKVLKLQDDGQFVMTTSGDADLPCPPLHSFKARDGSFIDTLITPNPFFIHTRILEVTMEAEGDPHTPFSILEQAASTIQDCTMGFKGGIPSAPYPLGFGDCPNLRSLKLVNHIKGDQSGTTHMGVLEEGVPNVHGMLNAVKAASLLEEIHIDVEVTDLDSRHYFAYWTEGAQWRGLDLLLSGPRFPSLRKLALTFNIAVTDHGAFDLHSFIIDTKNHMEHSFPHAHSSLLVALTIDVHITTLKR